jgi:hypothetical protein
MPERFSVSVETERGAIAAAAWLETNPDHPGIMVLAEASFLPFEESKPVIIAAALQLSTAGFKRWWATYGSEQKPSDSFTSGFLREIAWLRPCAAAPAPPEEPADPFQEEVAAQVDHALASVTLKPPPFTIKLFAR